MLPITPLQPGLRYQQTLRVDKQLTVPALASAFTGFADMPPVLATAYLVGFVEWTCIEALRPFLMPSQRSLGVHVDLSHSAPTTVGMTLTADVTLLAVQGRHLRFAVRCHDDAGPVCEGHHERVLVDHASFVQRARERGQPV